MRIRYLLLAMVASAALAACTTASRPGASGMTFASDPLIGKVVWHDLITEDLDASKAFYGELLGWEFEDSNGPKGQNYVIVRSGDVYVAGMVPIEPGEGGEKYSRWLPYISVPDVDEAVSRGSAAGGSVVASARNVDIGRVAAMLDPEGAVVGLARSSFGDPDDNTTSPAPGRVVWTELLAGDPAAAAKFYEAMVGYDVRTIQRRGGDFRLLGSNGVDRVGIQERPNEDIKPLWLTFFGVNDPAAAAKRAESLGGEIILPAAADLREGTVAVVTDPAGAVLVLQKWTAYGGEG